MPQGPTLYNQTVEVGKDFLGPAGERFMRRQITTHLGIEPEDLRSRDMAELVDWVRLTFALLTDDSAHVDAFAERLLMLAKQPAMSAQGRGRGSIK